MFPMSNQPAPKQRLAVDVSYLVGEECGYWRKFGEYSHQQAIAESWLDAQGKLTPTGLQAIVSEQAEIRKREELARSLKPRQRKILRSGIRIWGKMKTSSSPRRGMKTNSSLRTKKGVKSAFVIEVKTLLSKISVTFVHYKDDRLVVRIPNTKGGTTSHTFVGTMSEIRQGLHDLTRELEEKNR